MKLPKTVLRYCKHCNKHTEHKVNLVSSAHPRGSLKRGSLHRAKKRGLGRGKGNLGKWGSKPPVTKFKRKTKSTKKTNVSFTCKERGKTTTQKKGVRAGKIQLEQK